MKPLEVIRAEEVRRATVVARAHRSADALGALAFDVLSRQAEGQTLFAGREYVEGRTRAHGVDRDGAETDLGNLVVVLGRGPESATERAMVSAFAVVGLSHALADPSTPQLLSDFVRHADWLEVATPFVVYAFIDEILTDEQASMVWAQVAEAVLEQPCAPSGPRHDGRAHNAARLSALGASTGTTANEALARIAHEATDPVTRALARHFTGGQTDSSGDQRIRGHMGPRRRGGVSGVLRLVTGLAAAGWMLRLLARLVGTRSDAELVLVPGGLRLERRDLLLGRTVRERSETFTLAAIASVTRQVRYPHLHLLVGLIALSVGVLVGGSLLIDSVRTGETSVFLVAAVLLFAGAGLDLGLDVLVPARRGQVSVELDVLPSRSLTMVDVPSAEADRFLRSLRERVS